MSEPSRDDAPVETGGSSGPEASSINETGVEMVPSETVATTESTLDTEGPIDEQKGADAEIFSKKRKNLSPASSEAGSEDGDSATGAMQPQIDDDNQYDMGDGFMVGDEEAEDDGQRRKKSRTKVERKRLRKNVDKVVLDEDDLAIVEENKEDNELVGGDDVAADGEKEGGSEEGDDFISPDMQQIGGVIEADDELDDFIIDEGSDDEMEREAGERDRTLESAPAAAVMPASRRQASQHFAVGPTQDEVQESMDIFGIEDLNDLDLDDLDYRGDEDDDEGGGEGVSATGQERASANASGKDFDPARQKIERQTLIDNFYTEQDEVIRAIDYPERLHHIVQGRSTPDDQERSRQAEWMSSKLCDVMIAESAKKGGVYVPTADTLSQSLVEPIKSVLQFLQVEMLEVPFIWAYRRDYLHEKMTRKHLWFILALDEKWEKMFTLQSRILTNIESLGDYERFASGAEIEDELQSRSAKISELDNMLEESGERLSHLRVEHNATLDTIDNGDLDDTEISSYKEKVAALQEDITNEETNFSNIDKLLREEKTEFEKVKQVSNQVVQYRSTGILDVSKLFPKDRFSTIVEQCFDEQELKDVQCYLDLLLRGAAKDRGEVNAVVDSKEGTATAQRLQRKAPMGGHGKDTTYRLYRKNAHLRQLVEKIFVSAPEAGDALRHGFPVELPVWSSADHESACSNITGDMNETTLLTQSDVESAACLLVAIEYAAEPNIRRALRSQYRSVVTISTRPTPKGLNEITPFDPLFGLVYLDDMPIKGFYDENNKSLYMRLLQAEHDGFLNIKYSKPLCAAGSYADIENSSSAFSRVFGDLFAFFISQKSSEDDMESLQYINGIRLKAMIDCCNNHFIPSFEDETRRDLTRLGKDAIIEEACENFSSLLRKGPYRPPAMDRREDIKDILMSCPRRPFYAKVVCIYCSANSRQPIAMVYCDKDGAMLASDLIPPRAASRKVEMLSSFVKANRPDVIVLNAGGGRASKSIMALFEKTLIKEISESIKEESLERSQANDYYGADDDEDGYEPKVIMVKDEIADIFKQSPRSKKMFPDFDPSLCAAICLARYVQEPLAEYCNLWTSANSVGMFGIEVLFLKLHPLLHMVKSLRALLLDKLQCCLVDAVCDVGVDINLAVSHDHLASMLIFVCGLGLRKANHLRSVIKEKLSLVSNRKELLERKLLKKNVWVNASGFLRVDSMANDSSSMDPFDNTRIHPECYYINEWAPKICADSLEVEWTSSLDYTDIVSNLMKDCKKVLERKLAKSKAWIDLWRNGRPVNGKTKYKETVKNDQGMLIEKEFGCELSDAMSLLLIDDYCNDLESQDMGRHRLQFEDIKEELRFPWLDLRKPMEGPSQSDMFTIMTGETPTSLHVGMKIGCVITRVEDKEVFDNRTNVSRRQQRAQVVTDSGIKGFISMFEVSDDRIDENRFNMKEALPVGSKVMAVILSVNLERQLIDLSIKPSYLKASDSWWVKKRFELHHCRRWFEETARRGAVEKLFMPHFNERAALEAYESSRSEETDADKMAIEENGAPYSASKSTKAVVQRHVHHPLFINCSGKEAEERLRANQGGFGSVIIRPSSKGPDSLAITWGFQPNWFMHFEVEEKGKTPGALGLGKELYIKYANLNEPFSDLDEVFARFVDPMNDYVSLMISHRNFRDGSPEDVEAFLHSQLQDRPQNIPYCIRFEPSFAGCFVLTWIKNPNSKDPIKKSRIQVMPNGYFMEKRYFSRPGEIIQYLKKHTEKTANRPIATSNEGGGRKTRFR